MDDAWSIREIVRCGAQAVVCRPTSYAGRPFARFGELLDHLVQREIPLFLHGGTGYHQRSPLADQADDYAWTHLLSHPGEQMLALADLIGTGALERGLTVAILEAGCAWLPWFLRRAREHFPRRRDPLEAVEAGRILTTVPNDPSEIGHAITGGIGGCLCFGSDFPHWDRVDPMDLFAMLETSFGKSVALDILARNASRLRRFSGRVDHPEVAGQPDKTVARS
jgi:hypothetical protein